MVWNFGESLNLEGVRVFVRVYKILSENFTASFDKWISPNPRQIKQLRPSLV